LRVVAAFSEGRGEGFVWTPSKDLIFFSGPAVTEREEAKNLQIRARRDMSTDPSLKRQKSTDPSPKRQVYPEKSQFLSPSYDI